MSDNAKLIAEARAIPMPFEEPEELVLLDELADALEAADRRITQLEADDRVNWRADWAAQSEELRTERDALAAVIEQAKAALNRKHIINWENGQEARRAIAAADTDAAIREVRAKVWDECALHIANGENHPEIETVYSARNPYRSHA